MLDIILCIIFSASLIIIFKIAGQRQVRTLPLVVINYWVAAACGIAMMGGLLPAAQIAVKPWLPWAVLLGIMFITVFNFIGLSTLRSGIAVTAIAQKMSLAIPIIAAVLLFDESLSLLKVIGILLALGSIIMTTYKPKKLIAQDDLSAKKTSIAIAIVLPSIVFIGSGLCDTVVNVINEWYLDKADTDALNTLLFTVSATAGTMALTVQIWRGKEILRWRQLGFGIVLGIPNYFSLYFLLKSLQHPTLESSVVYPIVNIGVVITAALVAFFGFKEHLTKLNIAGIAIAIAAIYILTR